MTATQTWPTMQLRPQHFSLLAPLIFGYVFFLSSPRASAGDSPEDALQALPGFKIDLVLNAKKGDASFISLAKDPKDRLLLGGQRNQPLTRVTLDGGKVIKQEELKLPVSEIMGMLYAFDSLYVDGSDGKRFGLFRCRDTKGAEQFDSVELVHEWKGGAGEHGAHGIVLGPDKKLYVVCGNFTGVPTDLQPDSPHRNYADDLILPRAEDGNGFGAGKKPPGGFIVRLDAEGKEVELFASGERNTYDIAFNSDGELFGFDSDMEWDWGTPWYRPTRVYHATSGADQGFREGTGKWPEYYPDSLPAVVNIGLGSPTGVVFGAGAKFPAKYQKAFYVLDWVYGRVMAVHLKPRGSSYEATWENFVAPKSLHSNGSKVPNNVTDAVIGDDGAFYFTTGGRSTPGRLFRVIYAGNEPTAASDLHDADGADARALRHLLEAFHGHADAKAVDTAWPHLNDDDRFIRYAARLAIESQPLAQWKDRALAERQPTAAITALLALARLGGNEIQPALLGALVKLPFSSLSDEQKLDKLRVIEVSVSRHGTPAPEVAKPLVEELEPLYPAASRPLNRELCQVLLALDAPNAVAGTMSLLAAARIQEEQLSYVLYLRTIKTGWTTELRRQYLGWWNTDHSNAQHSQEVLKWFEEAGRPYSDGSSYRGFLTNLHADAVKSLSEGEKSSLADVLAAFVPPGKAPKAPAKARTFVKEWKMADLEPAMEEVGRGRNFEKGRALFSDAQCIACHRFGNDGGAVGPDLTAVASRFGRRDILDSIIEPSKVISEQYMNTAVRLKSGEVTVGRVVEESDVALVLQPNPLAPERVTVKKADVQVRALSKISPMPEGLVSTLTKDEILDLLAYIESAGRKDHPDFKKQATAQ